MRLVANLFAAFVVGAVVGMLVLAVRDRRAAEVDPVKMAQECDRALADAEWRAEQDALLLRMTNAPNPASSENYRFGPESHPGFQDFGPDEDPALYRALYVLLAVESGSNRYAVGDLDLTDRAYGGLQIRQPYLDDVNRIAGTDGVRQRWGKDALTISDMYDPEKAWWAAEQYLSYYGERYQKETGEEPTEEVYIRMHNGGPRGWERVSTNSHFNRASEVLQVLPF